MNNLHRELAPISAEAWRQIEEEAARTFKRHLAGRRVVDVRGPEGAELAAVGTGHLSPLDDGPVEGVRAWRRESASLVELRRSFQLDRAAIDDVERGAGDAEWQPVKDAAKGLAMAEDHAIFDGYEAAGITGLIAASTLAAIPLPAQAVDYPEAIAQGLSSLRMAGVDGPYAVLLSADAYTGVAETSDHGYPVLEHLRRLVTGEIIWAPALSGALLLSTRGGDFDLRLGLDVSIGYESHTADSVTLYLEESFAFLPYTGEAVVHLPSQSGD